MSHIAPTLVAAQFYASTNKPPVDAQIAETPRHSICGRNLHRVREDHALADRKVEKQLDRVAIGGGGLL